MRLKATGRSMVTVAGVLLGGALAIAQGPGMGPNMGPGGMGRVSGFGQGRPPMERALGSQGRGGQWWNNPQMITQLKLTDDQRKAMDGILLQHREQLIDLDGSLKKGELVLQSLMKADQPNETQILAQIDKVASARAELEKANARFLLDIRAKLTPDQWKQLQDLRANKGSGQNAAPAPRQGAQQQWGPGPRPRGQQGNPPPPSQGGAQVAPPPHRAQEDNSSGFGFIHEVVASD